MALFDNVDDSQISDAIKLKFRGALPIEETGIKLTTEIGRKFTNFFKDRPYNSQFRYWVSIQTFISLLQQSEVEPTETDSWLDPHTKTVILKLGYYADFVTAKGYKFPIFVSKVMQMYPEGTIFVETLDLEQTIHNNRKDLYEV